MSLLTTSAILQRGFSGGEPVPFTAVQDQVYGTAVYVHNLTTDTPLLHRNRTVSKDSASIVKLMTAIVVMQQVADPTTETVTYNASADDASPYFDSHTDGDVLTIEDALTQLILKSSNDTGNMLARHVGTALLGGSPTASEARAAFVSEMNTQAAAFGMDDTTFTGPSGGSAASTTAFDVYMMAREAFAFPMLKSIAAMQSATITVTGANARTYTVNHTLPYNDRTRFTSAKTGGKDGVYSVVSYFKATSGSEICIVVLDSTSANDAEISRYRDLPELAMQAMDIDSSLGDEISDGLTDPGARQRWRVRIRDGGNAGGYCAATTMRLLDTANGIPFDLSGATLTASHSRAGQGVALLRDRITYTWWGADKNLPVDKTIEVDFGSGNEKRVGAVQFAARDDFPEQSPRCFDVEYHDGSGWQKAWSERSDRTFYTETELRESVAPYTSGDVAPAIGAHAYWRLVSWRGGNPDYWSVGEIELRDSDGGADLASGGSPLYSQQRSGFEASKAFDNNLSTAWSPAMNPSVPTYIGYHLSSAAAIVQVAMTARDNFTEQMVRDFVVEYSDDGSTWTAAWAGYDQGGAYTASEERIFSAP